MPYITVLAEKLTCLQVVKKFSEFYGIRKFVIAFTSTCTSFYPEPDQSSTCFLPNEHSKSETLLNVW